MSVQLFVKESFKKNKRIAAKTPKTKNRRAKIILQSLNEDKQQLFFLEELFLLLLLIFKIKIFKLKIKKYFL